MGSEHCLPDYLVPYPSSPQSLEGVESTERTASSPGPEPESNGDDNAPTGMYDEDAHERGKWRWWKFFFNDHSFVGTSDQGSTYGKQYAFHSAALLRIQKSPKQTKRLNRDQ